MLAFQQPTPEHLCLPDLKTQQFRFGLVMEEAFETRRDWGNRIKRMDGICDMLYVAYGWAVTAGAIPAIHECHNFHVVDSDFLPLIAQDAAMCASAKTPIHLSANVGFLIGSVFQIGRVAGFTEAQIDACFREVHRSNMSKLWTAQEIESLPAGCTAAITYGDAYIVKREDGKVIKSPSYSPANLEPLLA
jgi:hypothetical protein